MRADRLVAILLLLQRRGRVTAAEVAEELEVSERTARRDLDALGVAGLPIYSVQGRGGGWFLAGDGRTDLSGLTAAETRALFLVAGPAADTPELRAALRKLVRALPEGFRDHAEAASGAVIVDPDGWDRARDGGPPTPPLLDDLQAAVVEGTCLRLDYRARDGATTTRDVHPLGLAAKGARWYLVADTEAGLRTFRVDRVRAADRTGATVVRPAGFDLADAWALISDRVDQLRAPFAARVAARPEVAGWCRARFGTRVLVGPTGDDGRVRAELRGRSAASLAQELAEFGDLVEVLDPPELRAEIAALARRLLSVSAPDPDATG
jgi:predicted DNA-binding transcriptional regulator YafY